MGGGWEVLEAGGLYSEEQTGCRNTAPEARVDARVANERK